MPCFRLFVRAADTDVVEGAASCWRFQMATETPRSFHCITGRALLSDVMVGLLAVREDCAGQPSRLTFRIEAWQ